MKAHWGVRALHACVFSFAYGVLEPPRASDCTISVVSGGLVSTQCDAPRPVFVVTELRELVFQLERSTWKHTGVCLRSMLAFLAPLRACWSRPVHLIEPS